MNKNNIITAAMDRIPISRTEPYVYVNVRYVIAHKKINPENYCHRTHAKHVHKKVYEIPCETLAHKRTVISNGYNIAHVFVLKIQDKHADICVLSPKY